MTAFEKWNLPKSAFLVQCQACDSLLMLASRHSHKLPVARPGEEGERARLTALHAQDEKKEDGEQAHLDRVRHSFKH